MNPRTDDKWGRRNFFATVFFGTVMASLGLGQLFYSQPSSSEKKIASLRIDVHDDVKVTEVQVTDTPLTPGTGTLRLGNVVASLDPATAHATASLANATQATVNAVNATHATANAVNATGTIR